MIGSEREYILEEEYLLIRHSGEIPEVALHASLYYLCEDEEGPGFILSAEELQPLQDAVLERYREIILRDLDVENRDLSLFRGINRAMCNWRRFILFCDRIGVPYGEFQQEAGRALLTYFRREVADVRAGGRTSSVNCSVSSVQDFIDALDIDPRSLPVGWASLCEQAT
ncbi:hypothetical protein [Desulfobulbus alkaliphilus]|uniref:hypothetical protein n=1 Tax=Desulfobulbus alkaliphilus TaxID=869814 RepID=UPI001965027B|nr:hypothetical protein [Desulfobulbus alkaliphilus]MBM9537203.1 hypothetical protein [Desulfobulbus alkaliphilus]